MPVLRLILEYFFPSLEQTYLVLSRYFEYFPKKLFYYKIFIFNTSHFHVSTKRLTFFVLFLSRKKSNLIEIKPRKGH